MARLTFNQVEAAFMNEYPKGRLSKYSNTKYTVCFNYTELEEPYYENVSHKVASMLHEEWMKETANINKEYNYSVSNLYELAKRLKLNQIVEEYMPEEKSYVSEEKINEFMALFN